MKVVEEINDAQQKLYEWREKFFVAKFNSKVNWAMTWITWGGDSAHYDETIPYQTCLIFVFFSPQAQLLVKFFSTQKRVNRDKTDFATKQRKL